MVSRKHLPRIPALILACTISACASSTSNAPTSSGSAAGEIYCTPVNPHPVCRASFTTHPSGTLGTGGVSTGTATIDGQEVSYTCYAGAAGQQRPRPCRW